MAEIDYSSHPIPIIYLTPEGYQALQTELEQLTGPKRSEIASRIRECLSKGEYGEDHSEIDEVRFEQSIVEKRITELRRIFSVAQVISPSDIPKDTASIGSYVQVKDQERGSEFEIRLVASIEADPDRDLVSCESPMGNALLGAKIGDTVSFEAPAGVIRYQITSIRSL